MQTYESAKVIKTESSGQEETIVNEFISETCKGEKCTVCGKDAYGKVGEEIRFDDPNPIRHNLTAYLCKEHFIMVLKPHEYKKQQSKVEEALKQELTIVNDLKVISAKIKDRTAEFVVEVEEEVPQKIELSIAEYINANKCDWSFNKLLDLAKYGYQLAKEEVQDIKLHRTVQIKDRLPEERKGEGVIFIDAEMSTMYGYIKYNGKHPSILVYDSSGEEEYTDINEYVEWLEPITLKELLQELKTL